MAFTNINLQGTVFTDYLLNSVGSVAFELEHDWFTQQDLVIRTAASGGGTLLVLNTHYVLETEALILSTRVSAAQGTAKNVYHKVKITNPTYQSCNLYFSGKYIADDVEAEDIQYDSIKIVDQANYTILDNDGYGWVKVTAGASNRTITLPTIADNLNRVLIISKDDDGAGDVVVDGEGAETIAGYSTYSIVDKYENVVLKNNGITWSIISSTSLVNTQIVDAVSTNTPSKVVLRDTSGNFAANVITASLSGNASTVTTLNKAQVETALTGTITSHAHNGAQIVDATEANTASKIVKRDASGNFSASTITAALSGNASSATTADQVKGVSFHADATAPTGTTRLNCEGYLYATRVYNPVYGDLAEFMDKDFAFEALPGDVLVQTESGLAPSSKRADVTVVGVYSDSFGYALNAEDPESKYPVALAGSVWIKVKEPLKIGDFLVSDVDGFASKATEEELKIFGVVIGKVLENKLDDSISRIKILVK
jgi:hypothetical protein